MRLSILTLFISTACFSAEERTFDLVLDERCKKMEAEIVRLDSLQQNIPSQFVNFQEKLKQARKDREVAATRKQGEPMDDVRKRVLEANQRLTLKTLELRLQAVCLSLIHRKKEIMTVFFWDIKMAAEETVAITRRAPSSRANWIA